MLVRAVVVVAHMTGEDAERNNVAQSGPRRPFLYLAELAHLLRGLRMKPCFNHLDFQGKVGRGRQKTYEVDIKRKH